MSPDHARRPGERAQEARAKGPRPAPGLALRSALGNRGMAQLMRSAKDKETWAVVSIKGQKQGRFPGKSKHTKGGKAGRFDVEHFKFKATAPRDPATGYARGRRQYEPASFTKEADDATESIRTALTTNEPLEITVEFFRKEGSGTAERYRTSVFEGCTISSMEEDDDVEDVKFVFSSYTTTTGASSSSDNWAAAT